jgi:hypothetical protein
VVVCARVCVVYSRVHVACWLCYVAAYEAVRVNSILGVLSSAIVVSGVLGVMCSAVVSGECSAGCIVSGEYSAARYIV